MSDYETKTEAEICYTCKFFRPPHNRATSAGYGLCTKRPRLHQKHDERTHETNWCQYYEADMARKELLADAIAAAETVHETSTVPPLTEEVADKAMDTGRGELTPEERRMIAEDEARMMKRPPDVLGNGASRAHYDEEAEDTAKQATEDHRLGRFNEARDMLNALQKMQAEMRMRSVALLEGGDNHSLFEGRGALQMLASIINGLETRIAELKNG